MTDANTDTGSSFSRVKYAAFGTAMKDLILADIGYALAGVDILGLKPLAFLQGWADGLTQDAANAISGAAQAQAGVAATNTQLSLTGAQPIHVGVDQTADPSIPYSSATDNINTNATQANWGFIRASRQAQNSVITYVGKVSGTVTGLYFDVYTLNTATGDTTLVYSTGDQSGLLGTNYSTQQFTMPTPLAVNYGEVVGIQARMTGSGTVWLAGRVTIGSNNTVSRPYQPGAQRNPSTTPAPSTITGSTMDTLYSASVPYFTFGNATQPTALKRNIADNFQNGSGAWVQSTNTGNNFTTSSGRAVFAGTTDGLESGIYQTPLLTDDFDCSIDVASPAALAGALMMATDVNSSAGVVLSFNSSNFALYQFSGGTGGTYSSAKGTGTTSAGSGSWYVTYRSATKTWSVYRGTDASTAALITWTEPSSGGPTHGAGHRFFGLIFQRLAFTNTSPVDNFNAKDV